MWVQVICITLDRGLDIVLFNTLFLMKYFISQESTLKQKINNSKELQEFPETKQIHQAPPSQKTETTAESHFQMR